MGKRDKSLNEIADLIERYLEDRSEYAQEWNDFVDSSQRNRVSESYRKQCYQLDPLVNRPEGPDPDATAKLRLLVQELRSVQSE